MCQMSPVACHVSGVKFQFFFFTKWWTQLGEGQFQQGLPRLVDIRIPVALKNATTHFVILYAFFFINRKQIHLKNILFIQSPPLLPDLLMSPQAGDTGCKNTACDASSHWLEIRGLGLYKTQDTAFLTLQHVCRLEVPDHDSHKATWQQIKSIRVRGPGFMNRYLFTVMFICCKPIYWINYS